MLQSVYRRYRGRGRHVVRPGVCCRGVGTGWHRGRVVGRGVNQGIGTGGHGSRAQLAALEGRGDVVGCSVGVRGRAGHRPTWVRRGQLGQHKDAEFEGGKSIGNDWNTLSLSWLMEMSVRQRRVVGKRWNYYRRHQVNRAAKTRRAKKNRTSAASRAGATGTSPSLRLCHRTLHPTCCQHRARSCNWSPPPPR